MMVPFIGGGGGGGGFYSKKGQSAALHAQTM
jgi:hypothetical protein